MSVHIPDAKKRNVKSWPKALVANAYFVDINGFVLRSTGVFLSAEQPLVRIMGLEVEHPNGKKSDEVLRTKWRGFGNANTYSVRPAFFPFLAKMDFNRAQKMHKRAAVLG